MGTVSVLVCVATAGVGGVCVRLLLPLRALPPGVCGGVGSRMAAAAWSVDGGAGSNDILGRPLRLGALPPGVGGGAGSRMEAAAAWPVDGGGAGAAVVGSIGPRMAAGGAAVAGVGDGEGVGSKMAAVSCGSGGVGSNGIASLAVGSKCLRWPGTEGGAAASDGVHCRELTNGHGCGCGTVRSMILAGRFWATAAARPCSTSPKVGVV